MRRENMKIHTLFKRGNFRRPQSSLGMFNTLTVNITDGITNASVGCTEETHPARAQNRPPWPGEASIVGSSGWGWWQVKVRVAIWCLLVHGPDMIDVGRVHLAEMVGWYSKDRGWPLTIYFCMEKPGFKFVTWLVQRTGTFLGQMSFL